MEQVWDLQERAFVVSNLADELLITLSNSLIEAKISKFSSQRIFNMSFPARNLESQLGCGFVVAKQHGT